MICVSISKSYYSIWLIQPQPHAHTHTTGSSGFAPAPVPAAAVPAAHTGLVDSDSSSEDGGADGSASDPAPAGMRVC